LIDALERYRLPKALQGKGLPPRLRKAFRDEDEVPASSDLNDQIERSCWGGKILPRLVPAFVDRQTSNRRGRLSL